MSLKWTLPHLNLFKIGNLGQLQKNIWVFVGLQNWKYLTKEKCDLSKYQESIVQERRYWSLVKWI